MKGGQGFAGTGLAGSGPWMIACNRFEIGLFDVISDFGVSGKGV